MDSGSVVTFTGMVQTACKHGVVCCFALLLAACTHTRAAPGAAVAVPGAAAATLGPDDVFELQVFGEADLSGLHRVAADGSVNVPLIGRVDVAELSPEEASDIICTKLSAYLTHPHVSIFVKESNSKKIYVFGEVRNPGTFVYSQSMNIVQAITLAGGFERLADKDGTFVTRRDGDHEQRLKVSVKAIGEGRDRNFALKPGDIVYVPQTFF